MMSDVELLRLKEERGVDLNKPNIQHLISAGYHYNFDESRWYHPDKEYASDAGKSQQELEEDAKKLVEARKTSTVYGPEFKNDKTPINKVEAPANPKVQQLYLKKSNEGKQKWDDLATKMEVIAAHMKGEDTKGWVVQRNGGAATGNPLDDYKVWSPEEVQMHQNFKKQAAVREQIRAEEQQKQRLSTFGEQGEMAKFVKQLQSMPPEVLSRLITPEMLVTAMRNAGLVQENVS